MLAIVEFQVIMELGHSRMPAFGHRIFEKTGNLSPFCGRLSPQAKS
jgi:hypothetical protein